MDRDRDRRTRDRDIPPEDRYGSGRGQSYRPSNVRERTPPRMDSYRARSPPPPRRPDYPEPYKSDSYRGPRAGSRSPPRRDDFRRRSPSPPRYREREPRAGDTYGGRPRSPPALVPRRDDLPRDDLFRRDEYRDQRDFGNRDRGYNSAARSPPRFRDRSPGPLKRVREPSPIPSRGRRTPPVKRERLASPRGARYDDHPPSRAVSPPRRRFTPDLRDRRVSPGRGAPRDTQPRSRSPWTRNDTRNVDDWRAQRSPVREPRAENLYRDESGRNSAATSRRSSPPVHPSRIAFHQPAVEQKPPVAQTPPLDPYDKLEPTRAPTTETRSNISTSAGDRDLYDNSRPYARDPVRTPIELPRDDDAPPSRAPPTGPVGNRGLSAFTAPPTGPAAASRPLVAPPAGPRGAAAPRGDFAPRGAFGGEFASRGRGGFGVPFRGGRGGGPGPGFGRGEPFNQDVEFSPRGPPSGPPSGPRNSFAQAPAPVFRQSSNVSATTYPRSQRFTPSNDSVSDSPTSAPKPVRRPTEPSSTTPVAPRPHPVIADLPKIIEGGQKADPLIDRSKLNKLEEESEKLRKQIEERETRRRRTLYEWDKMTRETEAAALRSDLAEQALKQLNGEAESQAAF